MKGALHCINAKGTCTTASILPLSIMSTQHSLTWAMAFCEGVAAFRCSANEAGMAAKSGAYITPSEVCIAIASEGLRRAKQCRFAPQVSFDYIVLHQAQQPLHRCRLYKFDVLRSRALRHE